MKNTVWVLTSEYNDYDQHGAYFDYVFKDKPSVEGLVSLLGISVKEAEVILKEGSSCRLYPDQSWYNLDEEELL